jgi:signal transduction histidine kinase
MTIDPEVLRNEQHVEVGRVIQRDAPRLIERWSRRATVEQPHGARAHHQTLLDHLPRFLQTLGQSLSDSVNVHNAPHFASARAHGEQRWESGWSLPEVVRDYQILRLVLFEYLAEVLSRPLLIRESVAIGLTLDEAISTSVTAYVQHQEKSLREQADRLREADQNKNAFLAVLAHELRNPLAPILSSVEVLRILGPKEGELSKAREIVERQVKQMVRIVDDLLDVTRVAQGKLQLRRGMFDLSAAIQQATQTVRPLYENLGHELAVDLPSEPLLVDADEARVVQVLVNLLTNAGKYTERGGQIRLSVTREDGEFVLRVRDNGLGIEPEMLGRVFDMFTQVGRSTHHSQGGLGIGLTLVRQLVELHGGGITVHSEGLGKGSEFVVRLPALDVKTTDLQEDPFLPATNLPPTPALRILLVEDNADAREVLATLLRLLGHEAETAATGPEGVERALASKPELVLIDLGLPELDGFQVARRLRDALGDSVKLVALTGHVLEEDRRKARDVGFDAHLAKPVELEELTQVLADCATK